MGSGGYNHFKCIGCGHVWFGYTKCPKCGRQDVKTGEQNVLMELKCFGCGNNFWDDGWGNIQCPDCGGNGAPVTGQRTDE